MQVTCLHCGHRFGVEDQLAGSRVVCPACGGRVGVPSRGRTGTATTAAENELALWRHERRRTLLLIAVLVLAILALLFWFLTHRSAPGSPARKIKNVVFGQQVTEAAEGLANGSGSGNGGSGRGQQSGQANAGAGQGGNQSGQAGGQSGNSGSGGAAGQSGTGQSGAGGDSQREQGRGHGDPLTGPVSGPANVHDPTSNPTGPAAPPPRSIGWLDRFFGTQRPDDSPVRAGEGGTGENVSGAGNTNVSPTSVTNPVAAQFTESNPPAPIEVGAEEPPPPTRSTNRAPPAANALNDNFEQLLRQNRAGSGDVRISLMWRNRNDIDLHVVDPRGEEIYYGHRASQSGGLLDIDMNASPPFRNPAVENVYWPQLAAPAGTYKIYVNHFRRHDSVDRTDFTVRVLIKDRTTDLTGSLRFGEPKKLVYQFTLAARPP